MRSPIAGDRFKSPVVTAMARRQLFDGQQVAVSGDVKQSLLTASPTRIQVVGGGGGGNAVQQVRHQIINQIGSASGPPGGGQLKRTGGLGLFFRKVYHLAHLRLDKLCSALEISDDGKRKIWTTFEHALREETHLMKDRHLDQILMCSLYIVCRVIKQNKNFTDIMGQYKGQPQAASHVYRSVLLRRVSSPTPSSNSAKKSEGTATACPPTPTRMAGTTTVLNGEERGDLIKFYNDVFLSKLQVFSKKFMVRSSQPQVGAGQQPPLSPLPQLRAHPSSPCKKVSDNHSVFVRNLKSGQETVTYNPHSPHKPLTYSFSRSPAKALVDINELMRTEKNTVRKRLLADPEPGEVTAGASENGGGGGPSVTYVTATGEIIDQRIVGEMHAAAAAATAGDGQSEAKKIIIPAGAATTTVSGMQVVHVVNTKLESILDDRDPPPSQ